MKKLLTLSIAMLMTVCLLAGCGKDNQSSDDSSETPKETTVTLNVDGAFGGNAGDEVNGVKTYKTITDAVNALSAMTDAVDAEKVINIKAGAYQEKVSIPKELKKVVLKGESASTTKLSYGDYAGKTDANGVALGTDKTATINIYGEGFMARNITFENSFDYLNPPQGIGDLQALAVYLRADKAVFDNCVFTGFQDTLETVEGRHYFKDCTIKGAVDFIFGNNSATLFENCDIVNVNRGKNGGYITATKGNNGTNGQNVPKFGLVFKGCRLTAEEGVAVGTISLGRPWRADSVVAWLNCEMGEHIGKSAYGRGAGARYTQMSGGNLVNYPYLANFAEFGNTGEGATQEKLLSRISKRVNGKTVIEEPTEPDFDLLTQAQADEYTLANIFATTNGGVTYTGEWDAAASLTALKA